MSSKTVKLADFNCWDSLDKVSALSLILGKNFIFILLFQILSAFVYGFGYSECCLFGSACKISVLSLYLVKSQGAILLTNWKISNCRMKVFDVTMLVSGQNFSPFIEYCGNDR